MVDKVSSSVVRVTGEAEVMTFFGPQHVTYVCSGEVIAVNRVLTAAHCVGESLKADGKPATALSINESYDLALLVVVTDKPALAFSKHPVKKFDKL